jgi:hypothetical protein
MNEIGLDVQSFLGVDKTSQPSGLVKGIPLGPVEIGQNFVDVPYSA